jgi:ADP-ribose pyrophosphatase YjhB (NUDIX family)
MTSRPHKNEFLHQLTLPRIGVGVIVAFPAQIGTARPRFAWLHRAGTSHGNNQWSLPGGRLEFNEKLLDCAVREVYEEIGVKQFVSFGQLPIITEDFFPEESMHWVTHYFLAIPSLDEVPRLMEPDKADALSLAFDPPGEAFVGAKGAVDYVMNNGLYQHPDFILGRTS